MSSIALYQKYRSQSFDELVGQEYVVRAIRNAVKENKVGHAYLFCGPRGTGKTSMARLLARAVNCSNPEKAPCNECENCKAAIEGTHPDIIEINAANETHVEDIRDLIDRARLSPMMGKHKIYIIDEVHQLSSSAASALLKTLEEPPEHVIFILATTDPQKLLKTIISRCQRFDFSKVDTPKIQAHLLSIAQQEGFSLEPEAAAKIAELADGGMRDSLSILEQARAYGNGQITEQVIDSIFGLASQGEQIALLEGIFAGNLADVLTRIKDCEAHGTDLMRLTDDLISDLKDSIIWQYTHDAAYLHSLKQEHASAFAQRPVSQLLSMIDVLMKAQERYRNARSVTSVFEVACLEMMNPAAAAPAPAVVSAPRAVTPAVYPAPVSVIPAVAAPAAPVQKSEPAPAEPATSEPAVKEEAPAVAEPVKELPKTLSVEEVLSILVQCTKALKAEAETALMKLMDPSKINRYSASLRQAELRAAGKDVLLFSAPEAAVHLMSEPEFAKELYRCLADSGLDRMPYVIPEADYRAAVDEYRVRAKAGTLPPAMKIVRYDLSVTKEDEQRFDTEQAVMNLFGSENVEIIDEGDR